MLYKYIIIIIILEIKTRECSISIKIYILSVNNYLWGQLSRATEQLYEKGECDLASYEYIDVTIAKTTKK